MREIKKRNIEGSRIQETMKGIPDSCARKETFLLAVLLREISLV